VERNRWSEGLAGKTKIDTAMRRFSV